MSAETVWKNYSDIDQTSANIHDGAVGDQSLADRAKGYVDRLFDFDREQRWMDDAIVVEIGGGHGWLMREVVSLASRSGKALQRVIDLDISENMLSMCMSLNSDQSLFDYVKYDGVTFPFDDESIDCFYSAACIQHIPKQFAYHMFIECHRTLKQNGVFTFHVLSTKHLPLQEKLTRSWKMEIKNQIEGVADHWHHFYSKQELEDVLNVTGFENVCVKDGGGCYFVSARRGRG